jgi:hypothetical protein
VLEQNSLRDCADDLCIYITGSYGRGEAVESSDYDLFFVADKKRDALEGRSDMAIGSAETARPSPVSDGDNEDDTANAYRMNQRIEKVGRVKAENQIRLFADLIQINHARIDRGFSRDCDFLTLHAYEELIQNIGKPSDDQFNYFTARMLLLLESKPLHSPGIREDLIRDVVIHYFRDYADHRGDFTPQFLINDILRYWRTLCLNYEAYRQLDRPASTRKENLKLRYSRKLTCFATVVDLLAQGNGASPEEVIAMTDLEPMARLEHACELRPAARGPVDQLQEQYRGFLELSITHAGEPLDDDTWRASREQSFQFAEALLETIKATGGSDALYRVAL